MSTTNIHDVLERLGGVVASTTKASQWNAICPAHDDRHASLSIGIGHDGKILLKCQAGCDTPDIIRALNLEWEDLFVKDDRPAPAPSATKTKAKRKIACTYDYYGADGKWLFQTVRWDPKDFSQRRSDGKEGWIWNLQGVEPCLYRLPELLAADPLDTVFVPEGEKDVDALRAWSLVATCNPMGAKKWKDSYSDSLAGRNVVILPDNDKSGSEHAEQVQASLDGKAASVRIVLLPNLPPKGDVSDWITAGGTIQQLFELIKGKSPIGVFPAPKHVSELVRADPTTAWLWKGFLLRGEVTLFSALWKAGKTTLLAYLLKAFETGGSFCGYDVQPASILYVTEENESRWAQRRDEMSLAGKLDFLIRPFTGRPRFSDWEKFIDYLRSLILDRSYDLVVFDTIANLWPVKDENDAAAVQAALMPLHQVVSEKTGMQLVHHTRKSDGGEATASRGSGALMAFVDTIVEFRRFAPTERDNKKRIITGYGRHEETPSEVVVELTDEGYVSCGGDRESIAVQDVTAGIVGILPTKAPGYTTEQLMDMWPGDASPRRATFLAALRGGVESGAWNREGEGKKGSPYTYWMSPFRVI